MCNNLQNTLMQLKDIDMILQKANILHIVHDIDIYQQAFRHSSYSKMTGEKNYEILEFYGDSIIAAATVEYLFERYGEYFNEGQLSKLKNKIVSTSFLSKFASFFRFEQFILLSSYIENLEGRKNPKLLEDCFEAFVAAISIDTNYNTAKEFVVFCLDNLVNYAKLLYLNENYKDQILNFFQRQGWSHPKYEVDTELGSYHKKSFVVNILKSYGDIHKIVCAGVGKTKKEAEMNASFNALVFFQVI